MSRTPRNTLLALSVTMLLSPLAALGGADTSRAANKPNIIFILADDLGIGSLSSYAADNFKTPNIDKLAASGIRFEHCYASPLCGPSRAMLLTGRYAFHTGMTGNDTGHLLKPANEIITPMMLKPAGYATGQVGKWAQFPHQPSKWGFDEYLRFGGSGKYWNNQEPGKLTYTVNGKETPLLDGEYLPDKMHDFAVSFITRHKDQPFYLYYAMSHVHTPILPTPDSSPANKAIKVTELALYQDNVAYMDKLVGKLMAELDRLKLREKTLVIFASDNGTAPVYKRACTINHGKELSGCKYSMLECGALIPMIASWPGTTPAGRVSQDLISFCDFVPTLAEVAGAKVPPRVTLDGRPFTPLLYGKTLDSPRDWIFVMLYSEWYDREMRWKLNQSGELFDMNNAPFTEPLVPANSQDKEALAARQRLQAVLTQLNPAVGKADPLHPAKRKSKTEKQLQVQDSGNANAPDE